MVGGLHFLSLVAQGLHLCLLVIKYAIDLAVGVIDRTGVGSVRVNAVWYGRGRRRIAVMLKYKCNNNSSNNTNRGQDG